MGGGARLLRRRALVGPWAKRPKGRKAEATLGIAMLAVGLIISLVAVTVEGSLSTGLFAAGFLLVVGGVMLLATSRRR